jgi:hypothetical protein
MVLVRGKRRRSKKPQPPFKLLDLPPEIVANICDFLDDRYLIDVRLVCRALCTHSVAAFGQRFFTHLVAILHPSSLAILMEISRHRELSKYVRKLTISGENVGAGILFDEDDMQPHVQLQASMKRSGTDKLMLADIFQKLSSLKVIGIDNLSYHADRKGLRCGGQYIIAMGIEGGYLSTSHCRFNPAFEIVFQSIQNSLSCDEIGWELDVWAEDSSEIEDPCDWFGASFLEWQQRFAVKVRKLEYTGAALLPFVTGLEELRLVLQQSITLANSAGCMFIWPRLNLLELEDTEMQQHHLIDFMSAHQAIITELKLNGITLTDGSWEPVFKVLADMPQLKHLVLGGLDESPALPRPFEAWPNDLEHVFDHDEGFLDAHGSGISIALRVLTSLSRFHTYTVLNPNRVDLRLAIAVIDGKAEYVDNEWIPTFWRVCVPCYHTH